MDQKTKQQLNWAVLEERLAERRKADGNKPLLAGMAARVDARSGLILSSEDADLLLLLWRMTSLGYPATSMRINSIPTKFNAHRVVLARTLGRALSRWEFGDHLNGNRADNRRENLRMTDTFGNARNHHVCHAKSGYFGVIWEKPNWLARLQSEANGKKIYLYSARFKTAREAAEAYNKAAEAHGVLTRNIFTDLGKAITPSRNQAEPA